MKKLLNFMVILGIFALNSSLIKAMGPKTELETKIFEQIDAAKKDGDSDIEVLNTNLTALLATENNEALINVLKEMKNKFFYYVPVRTPLKWHGKKLDKKRFEELKVFFNMLLTEAKDNFSTEQLYQTIKIFKEIIQNIGDENLTNSLKKNINNIYTNNLDLYKTVIKELVKPSELANKDFSKGDDGDIQYLKDIQDISPEIQELLINSAGYSKEEAQSILKYTLEDNGFLENINNKENYFNFLKEFLIALGDKANLNSFAQKAADANEQFKPGVLFGLSKAEYMPAYNKVFLKLGGQKVEPTGSAAPESDLGTALTHLSVELTALSAQL